MGVVYKVTNTLNGKSYIGITKHTAKLRWAQHCASAREVSNLRSALHSAIRKYGHEVFQLEELQSSDCWIELQVLERTFIAQYNTLVDGYNLTSGGQGHEWTADQKRHLSETNTGRRQTAESIAKIRAAQQGRPLSIDHKAKLSSAAKRRVRQPFSIEHRANMGAVRKGKPLSDTHREKLSQAAQTRVRTPLTAETRAKIKASRLGHKRSEESRHKQRIAILKRSVRKAEEELKRVQES
jgi:group I intron endonuclease